MEIDSLVIALFEKVQGTPKVPFQNNNLLNWCSLTDLKKCLSVITANARSGRLNVMYGVEK